MNRAANEVNTRNQLEMDVGDDTTGDGPQNEAERDDGELHHGLALEPQAVGDAQPRVGRDHDPEAPGADEERGGDGDRDQAGADAQRQAGVQGAAGDRPVPLDRMVLIGFGVDDVVDEVGTRGHDAEHQESADDAESGVPVAQDAGGGRCHEHEQVLDPLPGAHPTNDRAQSRAEAGRRQVDQRHGARFGWCLVGGHPFDRRHGVTADMVMKSRAHHDWK